MSDMVPEVLNAALDSLFTPKEPGELLSGKLNDALSGRLFCADFRTLQMCQSL